MVETRAFCRSLVPTKHRVNRVRRPRKVPLVNAACVDPENTAADPGPPV